MFLCAPRFCRQRGAWMCVQQPLPSVARFSFFSCFKFPCFVVCAPLRALIALCREIHVDASIYSLRSRVIKKAEKIKLEKPFRGRGF